MTKIVTVTYVLEVEEMADDEIENNIYENIFLGVGRADMSDLTIEEEVV